MTEIDVMNHYSQLIDMLNSDKTYYKTFKIWSNKP